MCVVPSWTQKIFLFFVICISLEKKKTKQKLTDDDKHIFISKSMRGQPLFVVRYASIETDELNEF